jgi:hypothetical protein
MALGFFRKRQKLIFILMVVLMVSFLVGVQGFTALFNENPNEHVIGKADGFAVTTGDLQAARADMGQLRMLMQFAPYGAQGAYMALTRANEGETSLVTAYAILLKEAEQKGVGVSGQEVQQFVNAMKARDAGEYTYEKYIQRLRQNQDIPESVILGILARWITVQKAYTASVNVVPPSREQLLRAYQYETQELGIELAVLSGTSFAKDATDPTESQISEMFEKYKGRLAGQYVNMDEPPFGYLVGQKVQLGMVIISDYAISEGAQPVETDIQNWIGVNQEKLNAAAKDGPKPTYPQLRQAALKALKPSLMQAKKLDVMDRIQSEVNSGVKAGKTVFEAQAAAVASLTRRPESLLNRTIPVISIQAQPLDQAIAAIAAQATPRLGAIVFPFGTFGKVTIDPKVKVSLTAKGMTVGEALAKIVAQVPELKLSWSACEGFDNVLFATGQVEVMPASAVKTALITTEQLGTGPMGRAYVQTPNVGRGWTPLNRMDFAAMTLNAVQPEAMVAGQTPTGQGTVLWRLVEYKPAQAPTEMDDAMKKRVVADCRAMQAFELAKAKAQAAKTPAAMKELIKAYSLKTVDTGLATQRSAAFAMGPALPNPTICGTVTAEAFEKLTPQNLQVEYTQASADAIAIPVAYQQEVVVMRRVDFKPSLASDFEKFAKVSMNRIMGNIQMQAAFSWFTEKDAMARTGFIATPV